MKRVGIYLRVSTDSQTTENQRRELGAVAARSGWQVVGIYEDAGISGAKGRDKRPDFDRLLKDATARKINMIAAWSVDRLGRIQDLVGFLTDPQALGCDLYLHQQALDTSTPFGRAMFQMCGVFAEFERGMIRERVNAGLARARAKGTKLGRRRVKPVVEAHIRELKATGMGILKIARTIGVGTSVVQRVVGSRRSASPKTSHRARGHNQPPVRVTDEQFAKMNAKQRTDYARQVPQSLESCVRRS
jgi:DNA invertase Pin-like site-specific DNA recombinase